MMMVQDQGALTIRGSNYLDGSSSKKQLRGSVDLDGLDADEIYKVVLGELFAFAEGSEENDAEKFLGKSKEKFLDEWFDQPEIVVAADCDVSHEAHENVAAERVDADESEMERDEEDYDPDYELFFRNLKPCGNAYVVEIASKNSTMIAKYEDEDDDEFFVHDEPRRKVPNSTPANGNSTHARRRAHSGRELKNLDIAPRNSSKYQGRVTKRSQRNTTRYHSRSHSPDSRLADGLRWNGKRKAGDKEKNETPNRRRLSRRIPGEVLVEDERCGDLQKGKSQHDGCLANMNLPRRRGRPRKAEKDKERVQNPNQHKMDKEYVKAFLSRYKMIRGFPVYIDEGGNEYRYEETDEECIDVGLLCQMNVESSAKPPSFSGRMTHEPSNKRLKSSDKRGPSDGMNLEVLAKPPPSSGRKEQELGNKRLRSSDERVPSDQMNVVGSTKPPTSTGRNTPETSNKRLKPSDKEVPSDPTNVEASAKPPPSSGRKGQEPNNKRLRSYGEKVSSDQMNVVASAKPPSSSGRMTPEASNKRLKSSDKRVSSNSLHVKGSISEFRKKAMEIFLKPYDRKEHMNLLKDAKFRRPKMHHKEMRGRSIAFPDDVEVDKSYLDRYEDLRKEVEAAQHGDPHKVLYLLRGLFHYLQCLCMDDSFIPWKDKAWMEAVCKSTSK